MFKIKKLLQLLINNLKDFIDTVLKDPVGYLLYKLIPSLILPIILKFILNYYLQNIVSEQLISLIVKVLNKILKRKAKIIFNSKMKIIREVVVYNLINYIKMILMDNITLNKNKINNMYSRLYTQIENKLFNMGILKIPP